jgi:hypothetical protein
MVMYFVIMLKDAKSLLPMQKKQSWNQLMFICRAIKLQYLLLDYVYIKHVGSLIK